MPNGKTGVLVDISKNGTLGIVEDDELINDKYELYFVSVSELRKLEE